LKDTGFTNGIKFGVAAILILGASYFFDKSILFHHYYVIGINTLVAGVFMFLAIKQTLDQETHLNFSEGLKPAFLCFLVGSLIFAIAKFVLINYIDPSLLDIQSQTAIETFETLAKQLNMSEEDIFARREDMRINPPTPGALDATLYWLVGLIFPGLVLSILISLVVKRN